MTVTKDDFEAWQAHPVTRYVIQAFTERAKGVEQGAKQAAWLGNLDAVQLASARQLHSAYMAMSEITFEDVQTVNGDSTEDAEE